MKATLLIILFLALSGTFFAQVNSDTSKIQIVDLPNIEASFPGGVVALRKYIRENTIYPEGYRKISVVGKIYVSFYIEIDGTVSEVEIIRGIDEKLDEMVMEMIQGMPKWRPAENLEGAVRSSMRFPVSIP